MASTFTEDPASGASPVSPVATTRGASTNPKMRKRTKTGCLTCRKRRIKCGEERPICNNCIRSKRQCEGYNQRVIFKPPIGDWPGHPGVMNTVQYHNSSLPSSGGIYGTPQPSTSSPNVPLPAMQNHQFSQSEYTRIESRPDIALDRINTQPSHMAGSPTFVHERTYHPPQSPHQPLHSPQSQLPTPTSATGYFPSHSSPTSTTSYSVYTQNANINYDPQRYSQSGPYPQVPAPYEPSKPDLSHHQLGPPFQHALQSPSTSAEQTYMTGLPTSSGATPYSTYSENTPSLSRYDTSSRGYTQVEYSHGGQFASFPASTHPQVSHSSFPSAQVPQHGVTSDVKFLPQHIPSLGSAATEREEFEAQLVVQDFDDDDHESPTRILDGAAIEREDNDYYDIQSDEEMANVDDGGDETQGASQRDFSLIQRMHSESVNELDIRRYDAFLYDGILTQYRPEQAASPLKNPKTARVFLHFIWTVGPTLSIFERNPRNPSSLYEGWVPPSQQSLWTYTIPLMALGHQGLLHAVLALSSVHIAKLQGGSITPSYKHYAYSLKRLGRALGNPSKRLQIPTLATSLLLAFYEVMTAEHVKWSTHLVGSSQLMAELDFRSLTRKARRFKAAQAAEEAQFPNRNPDMLIDKEEFEQRLRDAAMFPDEDLVSTIVGRKINYDDFGVILEEGTNHHGASETERDSFDFQNYETLQDFYWYYARHDMWQSIISGNPLIKDYHKWSDCPPRAPLGRADALYGTQDHLILLLARISDFIVRDRDRKVTQIEANGGHWRPTPGMPGFGNVGPSQSGQGQGQRSEPTTPDNRNMRGTGPPPGWTGPPPPGWPGANPSPSNTQSPDSSCSPGQGHPQGRPLGASPTAGPGFYGMAPAQPPISLPSSYAQPSTSHQAQNMSHAFQSNPATGFPDLGAAYRSALSEWENISHAHAAVASLFTGTPAFAPLSPDIGPPVPGSSDSTPFGPAIMHGSYDISILWCFLYLAKILLLRSHPGMPPASMVAAAVCAPATVPFANLIGRISAGISMPPSPSCSEHDGAYGESPEASPLTPTLGAALIECCVPLFFAGVQYQDPSQRDWLISRLLDIDRRTGWASAGVIARSCETAWERAGMAGRGPLYERRTRPFGQDERRGDGPPGTSNAGAEEPGWSPRSGQGRGGGSSGASSSGRHEAWGRGTRDRRASATFHHSHAERWDEPERRYVVRHRSGFVPWAMNLLADDTDLNVSMERVGLGNGNVGARG